MDTAAYDLSLVRRARVAYGAGDLEAAKLCAAELWLRYERAAYTASRRRARGSEAEEVFGAVQTRFIQWVYTGASEPEHMIGLISKMASFAYRDVERTEAQQPTTVEDIGDWGGDDAEVATFHDHDLLTRLFTALNDRERLVMERDLDDAPDDAIAAELGVNPNNLHQIRFRAMKKLRAAAELES